MPDYRRNRVPGGTYFFTVNLEDRRSGLLVSRLDILRDAVRSARVNSPFRIEAWAVLPNHMHWIGYGLCRTATTIFPAAGARSRLRSRRLCLPRKIGRQHGPRAANAVSGSAGIGSTQSATTGISPRMPITFI